MDLRDKRVANAIRRVTEGGRAKGVEEIDIDIAIDIPKLRALGADSDDRIDDFLPFRMKSRSDAGIGQHGPRCLGHFLGNARAARGALDQTGEETALSRVETSAALLREGFEGPESLDGVFFGN